jgi:hypothetical protein
VNKEKRYGSALASYRNDESLNDDGMEYTGNRPTKSPGNCSRNVKIMSNIWTKGEDDIRDRLNDLESNMYRATVNKQGQLKKYVENIHDKFNARINDRLENKQVDDNIKVIKSYGDYVTRTHKLQQRLTKKQ